MVSMIDNEQIGAGAFLDHSVDGVTRPGDSFYGNPVAPSQLSCTLRQAFERISEIRIRHIDEIHDPKFSAMLNGNQRSAVKCLLPLRREVRECKY
jgi:hypothetical protein